VRTLLVLAILAASVPARADGFAELLGGLAIPAGNSNWTNTVDPSPKLQARAGEMAGGGDFGGMLGIDWTPESLDNSGGGFVVGSSSAAAHRFRAIASAIFRHRIAPRITLSGRAGAGIDIAHASVDVTVFNNTSTTSDTDLGYAFELGGGVWFDIGSTQIGVELALPIGHHNKQAQKAGDITFDYTDIDIDLLVGVRL
jgi:hypothetical protein